MNKKVVFVVPDGTGIKNYLFSKILPELIQNDVEIIVLHNLSTKAINEVKEYHGINFIEEKLPTYIETKKQKFYRESICYARLLYNSNLVDNDTILTNWNSNFKSIKKVFYKCIEFYGRFLSKKYNRIIAAENKYQSLINSNLGRELDFLNKYNPTSIFCTHQRALSAVPVIKAAQQLGIKSIGAIYSWDNLPKARLTVVTDEYIVWSAHMKSEMELYYPEIPSKKIKVTGTPQFELYTQETNGLSKIEFFEKYNLDINKNTICFSGDDIKTSPFDEVYLEDLADSITDNNAIENYQILFRRCPVDLSDRYDEVLRKYPNLIIPIIPQWSNNEKEWTQLFPYVADILLLANICKYSDLVVNLGSTMALDFAYFNKPSAYLNYNPVVSKEWSVEMIYKFQHFRSMPHNNVVYWIDNKATIFDKVEEAIKKPNLLAKKWLKIINLQEPDIAKKIAQTIVKIN